MSEDNSSGTTEVKNGRPFLFTDPADLAMRIQNYFDNCDPHIVKKQLESGYNDRGETIWKHRETMTEQVPYTVTGLALELGVSRDTLRNYKEPGHWDNADISEETRQELFRTIEEAFQKVEAFNETQLHKNGIANGVKFNLTNNFGWVDKKVVDENVKTIGEALDDLDDPKEQRDNVAEQAAKELEKKESPSEPPGPETQE